MLKPSSKKVVKPGTPIRTAGAYNTPCVFGKEIVVGTAAHDNAQATVYLTGADPAWAEVEQTPR